MDAELERYSFAARKAEAEAAGERELRAAAQEQLRAVEARVALLGQQMRDAEAEAGRRRMQGSQSQAALRAGEDAAVRKACAKAHFAPCSLCGLHATTCDAP